MSTREWPFKLTDFKRLAKVATDMGQTISGYGFNRVTGELWVETLSRPAKPVVEDGRPNSFDQVLGS